MENGTPTSRPSVYLLPGEDSTYSAQISSVPPREDAIKLVERGEYPVEPILYYTDLNGSGCYYSDICNNDSELLEALNWSGRALQVIEKLWDYSADEIADDALIELFENVLQRRYDLTYEDGLKALSLDEDEEELSLPLEDRLRDAADRASAHANEHEHINHYSEELPF